MGGSPHPLWSRGELNISTSPLFIAHYYPRLAPLGQEPSQADLTWGKILFMSPVPSSQLSALGAALVCRTQLGCPAWSPGQPGGGCMGGPAWLHPSCGQFLPRLPASWRRGSEGHGPLSLSSFYGLLAVRQGCRNPPRPQLTDRGWFTERNSPPVTQSGELLRVCLFLHVSNEAGGPRDPSCTEYQADPGRNTQN